jgi:dihydroflavonol-4-reductase
MAERLVERLVAERGLPAVIVNPSTPIGPRDIRPTPTGRIVVEAASGRIPAFVDTGLNLVHVDDVARGHVLAMQKGVVGERYILGGQNVSLRQMLAEIAALTDRRAPTVNLPRLPLKGQRPWLSGSSERRPLRAVADPARQICSSTRPNPSQVSGLHC